MVLVDSNVLLDVLTADPKWADWAETTLLEIVETDDLAINPIVYAELAPAYRNVSELERVLRGWNLTRLPLPYEAGFIAGHVFVQYRRDGGQRRSPLPDFYIGAHAEWAKLALVSRDSSRYRTYFPKVKLIAADAN